jgi:hypothetical protein
MVGFRKPRKVRPKEKDLPKGYDSKWEHTLHETVLQGWQHHWELIPYIVKHKYEPDFVKEINGKTILLEAKGRFWDYPEYSKYIHIRNSIAGEYRASVFIPETFCPYAGS